MWVRRRMKRRGNRLLVVSLRRWLLLERMLNEDVLSEELHIESMD